MAWTAPVAVEVCVGMEITSDQLRPRSEIGPKPMLVSQQ